MNPGFLVAFSICFVGYLSHTIIHFYKHKYDDFERSKFVNTLCHILMIAGYTAWGFMLAYDSSVIPISNLISLPVGLLIGITGFVFFMLSTIKKRGFEEMDELVTRGIYRKFRNPMYIGIILIHIGFPFAFRRLYTLLSAVLWITIILLWKRDLERSMLNIRGELSFDIVRRYCGETPQMDKKSN